MLTPGLARKRPHMSGGRPDFCAGGVPVVGNIEKLRRPPAGDQHERGASGGEAEDFPYTQKELAHGPAANLSVRYCRILTAPTPYGAGFPRFFLGARLTKSGENGITLWVESQHCLAGNPEQRPGRLCCQRRRKSPCTIWQTTPFGKSRRADRSPALEGKCIATRRD